MFLLKWTVPIALGLFALSLWLVDEQDSSLRLERAVPPAHPVNTVTSGVAVVEIELERATDLLKTRMLYGESPFMPRALNALKQWRFKVPDELPIARTSVTFLFRPPAFYLLEPLTTPVSPWTPGKDAPALPQQVVDPGYPAATVVSGSVILEVQVDSVGAVTGVQTILGIEPLTEAAHKAVKNWKFSPATVGGRPVASTAYVVVSFVLPT